MSLTSNVMAFARPLAKLREAEQLTERSLRLYPTNMDLAEKWMRAVRWLRTARPDGKSMWVLDGAKPTWGHADK